MRQPPIERPSGLSGRLPGRLPPGVKLPLIQFAAVLLWFLLAMPLLGRQGIMPEPWQQAAGVGLIAAALGQFWRLPVWWLPINLLFIPAAWTMQGLHLPARWYLLGLTLLVLVYWGVARSRVPLYLSSRQAWRALAGLLPARASVADLGSGLGGLLAYLARERPDGRYVGVENAPLPFLFSRFRARLARASCTIRWGSFWSLDLKPFDLVYAYLSPVPMAELWRKAQREMRPGTLFVSNTFAVPGVEPSQVVQLDDLHRSRLYLYRL